MGKQTFNAVINGNRFASDSSSNHKIEGGFYGADAAEIAGKYEFIDIDNKKDETSNSGFGVFGGKKQTQ